MKEKITFIPHGNIHEIDFLLDNWRDEIHKHLQKEMEEISKKMFDEMLKKQPINFQRNCQKRSKKLPKETANKKSKETAKRFRGRFQKRST